MAKTKSQQSHCRRCGKTLPPVAKQHRDPFCSAVCCKADFHVVDKVPKVHALRGAALPRETRAA